MKSIRAHKKEVFNKYFSPYIRRRDCLRTTGSPDYGECISCDNQFEFSLLDAGHFIHSINSVYFDETNVHAQCRSCNRYKSGNLLKYRRAIVELYGEGHDEELERKSQEIKRFTHPELEQIKKDLQEKIKLLNEV